MTEQIFRVMDLKGVVRVDYIIDKAENRSTSTRSIPSPVRWPSICSSRSASPYRELIDRMVDAAIEALRSARLRPSPSSPPS